MICVFHILLLASRFKEEYGKDGGALGNIAFTLSEDTPALYATYFAYMVSCIYTGWINR